MTLWLMQSGCRRIATHPVAVKCLTLSRHAMGSSSRFESYISLVSISAVKQRKPNSLVRRTLAIVFTCLRLAADKLTSTLKARQISSQQEVRRVTKVLDFPDMELVAQRTFELQVHLVRNARSRRLYYLPCQVGVRGLVSQC